jgi:hypothetical protein
MNPRNKLAKKILRLFGFNLKQVKQIQNFNKESKFSSLNEEKIIGNLIRNIDIKHKFFVDIGADNGVSWSNTCLLAINGWSGLSVEYNSESFAELAEEYKSFPSVNLSRCMVTPENVVSLLSANEVPQELGVLSLDIDSYDYYVLEKILTCYRPSIICVEINERIPPPIKFTLKWEPNIVLPQDYCYGQSISQLYELCKKYDYGIVDLEFNNAFLVTQEISRMPSLSPKEAYRKGFLERPDRKEKFPWGREMEEIHTLSPEEALNFVENNFHKHKGKFICTL